MRYHSSSARLCLDGNLENRRYSMSLLELSTIDVGKTEPMPQAARYGGTLGPSEPVSLRAICRNLTGRGLVTRFEHSTRIPRQRGYEGFLPRRLMIFCV